MDSKRLKLLGRAYAAEIDAALSGRGLHMMQTKSALAETMVEEGYLAKCKATMSGATFEGYELTHFGRMAYCMTCEDELPNVEVTGAARLYRAASVWTAGLGKTASESPSRQRRLSRTCYRE